MKILLLFFIPLYLFANINFDSKIYYPQDYVKKKICYEIYSPEINQLLKDKLVYKGEEKLIAKSCLNNYKNKTQFKYKFENESYILSEVISIYDKKAEYITPIKMKEFLKGFEIKKEKGYWLAKSSNSDIANEILIFKRNNRPISKLIIKRAVGTTTLNLKWKKYKWSKGKYTLTKVEIERREGVQNISSTVKIYYHNLITLGLPKKITVDTVQNVISSGNLKKQTRKSKNTYYFENYKMI